MSLCKTFFLFAKEKKSLCTSFGGADSSVRGITDFCVILLKWPWFVSQVNKIAISQSHVFEKSNWNPLLPLTSEELHYLFRIFFKNKALKKKRRQTKISKLIWQMKTQWCLGTCKRHSALELIRWENPSCIEISA